MAEGSRRGIARMACAVGLTAAMTLGGLPLAAVPAWAGTITVSATEGNTGMTYNAYQIFTGTVEKDANGKRTITGIKWNTAAQAAFGKVIQAYAGKGGHPAYTGKTAQDAADYLASQMGEGGSGAIVGSDSLAGLLAQQLVDDGAQAAAKLSPGTASASLADGYYLVLSSKDSVTEKRVATAPVYTLVSGAVTINEKASVPTLNKEVCEDSTGTYGKTADANRGQSVGYRLTATLPNNLASYREYHLKFIDYLSRGLEYGKDAKVRVEHADGKSEELDAKSKATITHPYTGDDAKDTTGYPEGQSVLAVDLANLRSCRTTGGKEIQPTDKIVVEYTAKLNDNAVIGGKGNPNKARLVYSNNPHATGEGSTELVDPTLYTYRLNVRKRDKDKKGQGEADKGIAGAMFTLTVSASDGAADKGSVGKYVQDDGSITTKKHLFTSDKDGNIVIPGIDAGTYVLHEEKAPDGYAPLSSDPLIVITSKRTSDASKLEATVKGNNDTEVTVAEGESAGQVDVVVRDDKNVGMPQTGSAGFVAMIAGGGGLVAVSLAALMRRRP